MAICARRPRFQGQLRSRLVFLDGEPADSHRLFVQGDKFHTGSRWRQGITIGGPRDFQNRRVRGTCQLASGDDPRIFVSESVLLDCLAELPHRGAVAGKEFDGEDSSTGLREFLQGR